MAFLRDEAFDESDDGERRRDAVAAEDGDRSDRAVLALAQLPEPARRVLELMYFEGLTQRQVATVLGRPLGSVKTIARKALLALRAHEAASVRGGRWRATEHRSMRPWQIEGPFTTELLEDGSHEAFLSCRQQSPRLQPLPRIHVLLVDDDEHTRTLMESVLGRTGAHCTICPGAAEALSVLDAIWPDALVADIAMPGMDGYALMARVRALVHARGLQLPSLAFTASGREDERARALLAGFTAHLSKPAHPAAVVAAIGRLTADVG